MPSGRFSSVTKEIGYQSSEYVNGLVDIAGLDVPGSVTCVHADLNTVFRNADRHAA